MEIMYKYAVLGFCSDLTDPSSASEPIALLGIGGDEGNSFLMSIHRAFPAQDISFSQDDPFSQSILEKFESFISNQIDAGLSEAGPDGFLEWFQDRLRNTIHVGQVNERMVHISDDASLDELMDDFLEVFREKILQDPAP